ncbi:MAG TPA: glycoside hydrolase family 130 protein [Candidatus Limnocylindria bacterium]|nr:glycoside hydrolase family 130 protein [Candidatus Limnocylindria bacterium]
MSAAQRAPRARVDLGSRLPENPLLSAHDVTPSQPALEVVSVFNAATAVLGDEVILLLRVAERPRSDIELPRDALTLDFTGPHPVLRPLPRQYRTEDVIGMAFMDATVHPPQVRVAYIPTDLPGLDLRDPRGIRYKNATGSMRMVNEGFQDYLAQISHLRVARSKDGVHFTVDPAVAIGPDNGLEEYGVEDPRITFIDGAYHVTYVSVSRWGITTSLATTTDFRTFDRKGVIFLPDHKDVTIFPERVGGKYVALTRPMPQSFARIFGIWIAFSDDLRTWGGHLPLALPRWGSWDELRTGASAVPFKTERGWLELYHGVDRETTYAMGALLLDLEDPTRIIARSAAPILGPTEIYECMGLFNDTVFSCGVVPLDDRGERIRMYYGAADSVVAAADFDVREILDSLEPC